MTTQLAYAKGPLSPPVSDVTIGQVLADTAAQAADAIAMTDGSTDPAARCQWTYAELYDEAQAVARTLLQRFEPGERLAVWAPNMPEWVLLQYGCALAGIVLVTVNPSFQEKELAYVLQQSRSAGVVVLPEFRGNRMLQHVEAVRDQCPTLREVIRFDQWQDLVAAGRELTRPLPETQPLDACMIQYTSGTTGFPKGAVLHHRGLLNNAAHVGERTGMEAGGAHMGYMPLFHTGGSVLSVLGALHKRANLVVVQMFDPGLILELMETYRARNMFGVPTMLLALMEHPDFTRRDLSSLQAVTGGGATVPTALVEKIESGLGAPFTIVFGQTECSPVASMTSADDSLEDKANTLGSPMPHVEVKIIDPASGETLPVGELGEYCTRGYHVMHGYFDMPEATAEAIDDDGWLHTGDLCAMDERGYTRVEGRLKDMIIRGGENIYPREIEELLFKHPAVADVAVVGLPSERMGEEVAAFLRPAPGETLDREVLFAYVREHLSPQKTPRYWFQVDEYPMTGSGKIQKFVLRNQWQEGAFTELQG